MKIARARQQDIEGLADLFNQYRQFYEQLPFVVAAARDEHARPWATLLVDADGIVSSPNERSLHFRQDLVSGDGNSFGDEFSRGVGVGIGFWGKTIPP